MALESVDDSTRVVRYEALLIGIHGGCDTSWLRVSASHILVGLVISEIISTWQLPAQSVFATQVGYYGTGRLQPPNTIGPAKATLC